MDEDGHGAGVGDDVDDDLDDARDDGDDDGDDLPIREVISPAESARRRWLFLLCRFPPRSGGGTPSKLSFLGFLDDEEYICQRGPPEAERGAQAPPRAARGGAAWGGRLGCHWLPSGCSFACLRDPSGKYPPSIFR